MASSIETYFWCFFLFVFRDNFWRAREQECFSRIKCWGKTKTKLGLLLYITLIVWNVSSNFTRVLTADSFVEFRWYDECPESDFLKNERKLKLRKRINHNCPDGNRWKLRELDMIWLLIISLFCPKHLWVFLFISNFDNLLSSGDLIGVIELRSRLLSRLEGAATVWWGRDRQMSFDMFIEIEMMNQSPVKLGILRCS